ncbi:MAG: accessory factor UbiK family protein [Pseudomonadota bacterium]|uniref:accessory factor UbiK family protein n=1 Tax=Thermithiobacillus tepidarius TaxID=929 RepID=UPI000423636E|nr:accessory factor UbiK family protein [Thermithiobacillus tepidarius]
MIRNTLIDEVVRGITETVVKLGAVKDDVEKQVRATISANLDKLDLVSRDEFEVQRMMVTRLRERLEALEKRVAAFEEGAPKKSSGKRQAQQAETHAAGAAEQWANDEPAKD